MSTTKQLLVGVSFLALCICGCSKKPGEETTTPDPVPDRPVLASSKGWKVQVRTVEYVRVTKVENPPAGTVYEYRYALQQGNPSDFIAIVLRCIYDEPSNLQLSLLDLGVTGDSDPLAIAALGVIGDEDYRSTHLTLKGDPMSMDSGVKLNLGGGTPRVSLARDVPVAMVLRQAPKGKAVNLVFVIRKPHAGSLSGMQIEVHNLFDIKLLKTSFPY